LRDYLHQSYRAVVLNCSACGAHVEESDAKFCPSCGNSLSRPSILLTKGDRLPIECGTAVLGAVLGSGGMGVVRRAELHYTQRLTARGVTSHPVAVKLLNPMLNGSSSAERMFLGEAEALSRLAHPNIVHFFGLARLGAQLAIVMEFVHGKPLSAMITEAAQSRTSNSVPVIPMFPAWKVFSQLLGALASIHALGIIHRDIKPSNILVRPDGVVKLTDFGIARLPMKSTGNTGNVAPGTGAYMSPEQVTASELDARSDLYAAAIVLFEMLTGRTPFETTERSEMQLRIAQVNEAPAALSSVLANAPAVLDVFFARCLAKDRLHRYETAIEMGEALRTALGLPDTSGWAAERRLAAHAVALSRQGTKSPEPTLSEEVAEELRTGVMAAYQGQIQAS
jgi:serine/threonine-protein kinase